jgi:hypothetical protein
MPSHCKVLPSATDSGGLGLAAEIASLRWSDLHGLSESQVLMSKTSSDFGGSFAVEKASRSQPESIIPWQVILQVLVSQIASRFGCGLAVEITSENISIGSP